MPTLPNALDHRQADHPVESLFLKRWSPRAMNGAVVSAVERLRLFEAARWAPSSFNEQEWRFLYAHRESPHWETYFGLLMEANQSWCQQAGLLLIALSKKTFTRNGNPNSVHALDTGMAVQNLLLQAASMGLVAHPMAGFNRSQTRQSLNVPEDFEIQCMIAVGHPGDPQNLPENYRNLEVPSGRKAVAEFTREGGFSF